MPPSVLDASVIPTRLGRICPLCESAHYPHRSCVSRLDERLDQVSSSDIPAAPRRTFAIISHPDAGKTTVTECLLLLAGAVKLAGTVKARKSGRMAKSDWMAIEQDRGISVTTSVMQVEFDGRVVNLLDTPGHVDFSEDTYRTLTAVDSAVMVIDAAKGVEPRTRKLLEICRLRDIPILTFINKLDRESMDAMELLDQIEDELQIQCASRCWPLGAGHGFRGLHRFDEDRIHCYSGRHERKGSDGRVIEGLNSGEAERWLGQDYRRIRDEIETVRGAGHAFNWRGYREGWCTPVYFGSALHNFGVDYAFREFVRIAPPPGPRRAESVVVDPADSEFTGFVFKIQANMNPKHRDRIAFLRICSGEYQRGMKLRHVRVDKEFRVRDAVTFVAGDRHRADTAHPGDIIGLHNRGTIHIGDTFTERSDLAFVGVPSFAPELFRTVRSKDPASSKRLETGLRELSEEGAAQFFRRIRGNELIVGAVGELQFDLVAVRLKHEYRADCAYGKTNVHAVRWVSSENPDRLKELRRSLDDRLAIDSRGHLAYLASSHANLAIIQERWPEVSFADTREQGDIPVK